MMYTDGIQPPPRPDQSICIDQVASQENSIILDLHNIIRINERGTTNLPLGRNLNSSIDPFAATDVIRNLDFTRLNIAEEMNIDPDQLRIISGVLDLTSSPIPYPNIELDPSLEHAFLLPICLPEEDIIDQNEGDIQVQRRALLYIPGDININIFPYTGYQNKVLLTQFVAIVDQNDFAYSIYYAYPEQDIPPRNR